SGWRFRSNYSEAQNDLSEGFSSSQSGQSPSDHANYPSHENIADLDGIIGSNNIIGSNEINDPNNIIGPSANPLQDGQRPFIRPQSGQEFSQGANLESNQGSNLESRHGTRQSGDAPVDELSTNSKSPNWVNEILDSLPKEAGLNEALSALEEALLRKAMSLGGQVQSRAADLLGLRRNSFKYKWDTYSQVPPSALSEIVMEFAPEQGDLVSLSASLEEEMLRRALVQARGSQAQAADILGLKRSVLPYKLKKFPALSSGG
ncbi:MAG: hypothetical protein LBT62_03315, partial [Deltaproteobacteria bacterium]|nr:hypothetical protein [Deltaproteobacteria bacterium]